MQSSEETKTKAQQPAIVALIREKPPAGIPPFLFTPSRTFQMMINH